MWVEVWNVGYDSRTSRTRFIFRSRRSLKKEMMWMKTINMMRVERMKSEKRKERKKRMGSSIMMMVMVMMGGCV